MSTTDAEKLSEPCVLNFSVKRKGQAPRALVHANFESAIAGSRSFLQSKPENETDDRASYPGWSPKARANGLFVDLHKVEWFDLTATARLVLFVERAVKDGIHVNIAMPFEGNLPKETTFRQQFEQEGKEKAVAAIDRRIARRKKTLDFLEAIRFHQAIECRHIQDHQGMVNIISSKGVFEEVVATEPIQDFEDYVRWHHKSLDPD